MRRQRIFKLLSIALCIVLIAAVALMTSGCNDNSSTDVVSSGVAKVEQEVIKIGSGNTKFDFTVVDKDGNQTNFEVSTDKTIVGQALLDLELIAGEVGDMGLYVQKVNGITLDYNTDGMYWAFYINDEYAMSGVDATEIKSGETYSFKASK